MYKLIFLISALCPSLFASISAQKSSSPNFILGKSTSPNMTLAADDNPELKFKLGIRIMGTFESVKQSTSTDRIYDFYGRRVRLEAGANFTKNLKFKMDLRNDKVNFRDTGDGDFNIGDAKLIYTKPFGSELINFAFYRIKVDVSRSETIASSNTVYYDRAYSADFAAEYVSHGRRAMNFQMFGDYNDRLAYQLVVGDGVNSSKLKDAAGNKAVRISSQNPMVGAKIKVSPIPGWEDPKPTETYFGVGQHFTVGVGIFNTSSINYVPSTGASTSSVNHTLLNMELSAHYRGAFIQMEYFQFRNMVRDFTVDPTEKGNSAGGYVLVEYCLSNLGFLAPFGRYEYWNKFETRSAYRLVSKAIGLNWYLKGNTTKVGAVFQVDDLGASIGNRTDTIFRVISQIHF